MVDECVQKSKYRQKNDRRNYGATKNNLGLLQYSKNKLPQPECYTLPHFSKETYNNWHSAHQACVAWASSVGVDSLSKIKTQKSQDRLGCNYRRISFGCSKCKKRPDLNDPRMCSFFINARWFYVCSQWGRKEGTNC